MIALSLLLYTFVWQIWMNIPCQFIIHKKTLKKILTTNVEGYKEHKEHKEHEFQFVSGTITLMVYKYLLCTLCLRLPNRKLELDARLKVSSARPTGMGSRVIQKGNSMKRTFSCYILETVSCHWPKWLSGWSRTFMNIDVIYIRV